MRISRIYISVVTLVILALCASCRQDLCYDHYPAIDLKFSWEQEWERDYGMSHKANWDAATHHFEYDELRPQVPEWVKTVRYFNDGHYSEHFFDPQGARFEVEEDQECSILFYNGDTEYIILSDVASLNDVRATATSRTRAGAALQAMQEMYGASRTTNPPDVIFSSYLSHVEGIMNHEVRDMPVKMQPLVYTYIISYEFDEGLDKVVLARGALGGMAEGVYLRTGVTTDETSIILFDCTIHEDACRSQVRSFGIPSFPDSYFGRSSEGTSGPFSLNLEVKLKSGKTMDFNFDISDQIKNQPRGGVIKVGGITVIDDEEPSQSSGFDVDVSDWGDDPEIIDVPIGPMESE